MKNAVYLWHQPLEVILKERENTLKILNNKTKELDFFSENRLIYAFQRNIVRGRKKSGYLKWFEFADKSRNLNNVEEDFSQFNNDEIMAEVIKRLKKDQLAPREFKYVSDLYQYEGMVVLKDQIIEKMQAERIEVIRNLWKRGNDIASIAEIMSISIEDVKALVQKNLTMTSWQK